MLTTASPRIERQTFLDWYARNRARTAQLFGLVEPASYTARPIPLRHPIVFYEGHIPAFSYITLNRRGLGAAPLDEALEQLFERGIDPADATAAQAHTKAAWPARAAVLAFGRRCDAAVIAALQSAQLDQPQNRRLVSAQSVYTMLEHEQMHHETLLYILHRLPYDQKIVPRDLPPHVDRGVPPYRRIAIAAGKATLGAERSEIPFGWDNEFERTQVDVAAFEIDEHDVTNAQYLEFVNAGGCVPPFWVERDGKWKLATLFAEIDLPRSWPVYTTHVQATAYAEWKGLRLPSEAEYHRAAFGSPDGAERSFPWGEETPHAARHGNFDFAQWDPVPVGSYPAGASAWGVHDMVGNGWEWTSTPFAPLPGFAPMASYLPYSSDFFDNQHYVAKGASPVTARELVRRSLRNWYRPNYPYVYATFRCAL